MNRPYAGLTERQSHPSAGAPRTRFAAALSRRGRPGSAARWWLRFPWPHVISGPPIRKPEVSTCVGDGMDKLAHGLRRRFPPASPCWMPRSAFSGGADASRRLLFAFREIVGYKEPFGAPLFRVRSVQPGGVIAAGSRSARRWFDNLLAGVVISVSNPQIITTGLLLLVNPWRMKLELHLPRARSRPARLNVSAAVAEGRLPCSRCCGF